MGKMKNETVAKIRRVAFLVIVCGAIAAYITGILCVAWLTVHSILSLNDPGGGPEHIIIGGFVFFFLCILGTVLMSQDYSKE